MDKTDIALGEGKGTDMGKVVQQFESAGRRIGTAGQVTVQEVVVEKLIDSEFTDATGRKIQLAGPGYGVDAQGYLLDMRGPGPNWSQQFANGLPIKVIVMR